MALDENPRGPKEFARLQLLQEVTTDSGGKSNEIVFYRPSAKDLFASLSASSASMRIEDFLKINARALNGTDKPEGFRTSELSSGDVVEVIDLMTSLQREADQVTLAKGSGDGVTSPIVYTLQHPINLTPGAAGNGAGDNVIHQIQFEARKLGELSEFLDASGEAQEFSLFMRLFGTLLGTKLPMSDSIINALDFVDYYAIRRKIMGKLVQSRERWKKTSTSSPSPIDGPQVLGIT
jgi:hypothetical protein